MSILRGINKLRGEKGSICFHESYGRIIRDEAHLWNCLQ